MFVFLEGIHARVCNILVEERENGEGVPSSGGKRKSSASSAGQSSKSSRTSGGEYQQAFTKKLIDLYTVSTNGTKEVVSDILGTDGLLGTPQGCHLFPVGKRTKGDHVSIFKLMKFVANDGVTIIDNIYSADNGFLCRPSFHMEYDKNLWGIRVEGVRYISYYITIPYNYIILRCRKSYSFMSSVSPKSTAMRYGDMPTRNC